MVAVQQYANHELALHLCASVRGDDVFLIQSGSESVNDHLMELLIMVNACKIASARRITVVMPYFPCTTLLFNWQQLLITNR